MNKVVPNIKFHPSIFEILQEKPVEERSMALLREQRSQRLTEENVEKLLTEKGNKEQELNVIKGTTINKMWNTELDNLLDQYLEYKELRQRLMDGEETKLKKKKVTSKGAVVKKTSKNLVILDE